MTANDRATIVGVFVNPAEARRAVSEVRRAGFREDQIGVVSRAEGHTDAGVPAADRASESKVAEGTAIGAATGAGVGALWALGIAAGVLPVIGPVIAGGLLASVLASAGGGAIVGGILGALVGLGIPEHEARYYEGEVNAGRSLVVVKPEGGTVDAVAVLRSCGAYDMQSAGSRAGTASGAP
jgi:hypothetical protein